MECLFALMVITEDWSNIGGNILLRTDDYMQLDIDFLGEDLICRQWIYCSRHFTRLAFGLYLIGVEAIRVGLKPYLDIKVAVRYDKRR